MVVTVSLSFIMTVRERIIGLVVVTVALRFILTVHEWIIGLTYADCEWVDNGTCGSDCGCEFQFDCA